MTAHTPRTEGHTYTHKHTVRGCHKRVLLRSRHQRGYKTLELMMLYSRRKRAALCCLLCGSCPVRPSLMCEHEKKSAKCKRARCNRYDVRRMLQTCVAAAAAAAAAATAAGSAQRDGRQYGPCSVDLARCDSLRCKHNSAR